MYWIWFHFQYFYQTYICIAKCILQIVEMYSATFKLMPLNIMYYITIYAYKVIFIYLILHHYVLIYHFVGELHQNVVATLNCCHYFNENKLNIALEKMKRPLKVISFSWFYSL